MNERYNGWSNYETWNWYLWHGNDVENDFGDMVRNNNRDPYKISRALESWTDELGESVLGGGLSAGFFSDILSATLSRVDWYELAEHIIDEIEPEETDEDEEVTK